MELHTVSIHVLPQFIEVGIGAGGSSLDMNTNSTGLATIASIVPYESFPTLDGGILLGGGNDRLYGILCEKIGEPEWATDERFKNNALRVQNRDVLVPMIAHKTKQKTTQVMNLSLSGYAAVLTYPSIGMARNLRRCWYAICPSK